MENKTIIVILFLLASANVFTAPEAMESEGGKCPPGHFLLDPEAHRPCRPCPPGTFQSRHTGVQECLPHSESCQDINEEVVREGDSTQDKVCQCREGHERKYVIHDPLRGIYGPQIIKYLCIPCPAGYVAKPVSNPLKPGDTHCCLPHLFPVRRDWEFLCENTTSTTTATTTSHIPSTTAAAPPATTELCPTASTGTASTAATTPMRPHGSTKSSTTSPSRPTSVVTTPGPAVTANLSTVNPVSDGAVHMSVEDILGTAMPASIIGVVLLALAVCCCLKHRRQAGNLAVPQPETPGGEQAELLQVAAPPPHPANEVDT